MHVATLLLLVSSVVIFGLGLLHLVLTFRGKALWPRADGLHASMSAASPRISSETTMWRAWIGFNASHSMGALLYGVVFGYLALAQPAVFLSSLLLQVAGGMFLAGYCLLGWFYWFSRPFAAIVLASAAYAAALLLAPRA